MKPFTLVAAIIFALMALVHAYRLLTGFEVIVGSQLIPNNVSWIAVLVSGLLSYGLFREARH